MFTFEGETILDPFLGSGTTIKVALNLKRNSIGYEINEKFLDIIKGKLNLKESLLQLNENNIQIIKREKPVEIEKVNYIPRIKDAKPKIDPEKFNFKDKRFYKVVEIIDEKTVKLNTGLLVKFLGVEVVKKEDAVKYLKEYVLKRDVFLKFDNGSLIDEKTVFAYVYLKNKIFLNSYLIKSGLAIADKEGNYKYKRKFIELEKEAKLNGKGMDFEYCNK